MGSQAVFGEILAFSSPQHDLLRHPLNSRHNWREFLVGRKIVAVC